MVMLSLVLLALNGFLIRICLDFWLDSILVWVRSVYQASTVVLGLIVRHIWGGHHLALILSLYKILMSLLCLVLILAWYLSLMLLMYSLWHVFIHLIALLLLHGRMVHSFVVVISKTVKLLLVQCLYSLNMMIFTIHFSDVLALRVWWLNLRQTFVASSMVSVLGHRSMLRSHQNLYWILMLIY